MVQWPTVSPYTQGDMIAFNENSSGHKHMRQARSDSSLHDSCVISDLMTSTGARKVTFMWGMDIPWPVHFPFFPFEVWKSSLFEGL